MYRAVASGGAGGPGGGFSLHPPVFGQTGGQIMPTTVLQAPPGFSDLATALILHSKTYE